MTFPARPVLDEDNTPFWTWGEQRRLAIHRCNECGRYSHPPAPVCRWCLSRGMRPAAVSGQARLYAYSHNVHDWSGGSRADFVFAIVELREQPGLRLSTHLVDCAPDDIEIGMPVFVDFRPADGIWYPVFRPERG